MKRRRRPVKAITMIELGVAGILLVLLVLLVYWYVDGLSAYKPGVGTYQIIGQTVLEYAPNATFRSSDGNQTVTSGSDKMPMLDTPILYRGDTKLTLSRNMLLMVPSEGTKVTRINQFTTLTKGESLITYTLDNKSAVSYGGFLYDGEDTYIFLDDSVLTIGPLDIELPALSYARVQYNNTVEYHNSETDESDIYPLHDVEVTLKTKDYELNLGKDVIYTNMGEALLYSAVDNVKVIEMN